MTESVSIKHKDKTKSFNVRESSNKYNARPRGKDEIRFAVGGFLNSKTKFMVYRDIKMQPAMQNGAGENIFSKKKEKL